MAYRSFEGKDGSGSRVVRHIVAEWLTNIFDWCLKTSFSGGHRLDFELPLRIEQLIANHGGRGPVMTHVLHAQSDVGLIVARIREIRT